MIDAANSRGAARAGWILTALVALAMVANGVFLVLGQLLDPAALAQMSQAGGFTVEQSQVVGVIMLVCATLYVIPRTAMLGAILLTGFAGGALCTEFRIGLIFSGSQLVNLLLGVLPWAGLYLRDVRMRALLPLRSPEGM